MVDTLVGYTDLRGETVWEAGETETYDTHVPVGDVLNRLFNWHAVESPVTAILPTGKPGRYATVTDNSRKVVVRPDTQRVLGVFKASYTVHQYDKWLVDNVANLLKDDLQIGAAGVLKDGALGWASLEQPWNMETPNGIIFRPNLIAVTSLDGTIASTFQRIATIIDCGNMSSVSLSASSSKRLKVKHTRHSATKIQAAPDAQKLLEEITKDFVSQTDILCRARVTRAQWYNFLDAQFPVPVESGRGKTMAENAREALDSIYQKSAFKGTAWGVLSAVNTYVHHEGIVRKAERAERNLMRAVTGGVDALDTETLERLNSVLGKRLVA